MGKHVYDNILETIGDTPLVRINSILKDCPAEIYAKVEYFNPGQSIKDRIGLRMVEDAEKAGLLKPGGTIIECTSGNTGMGLALAAIVKGYHCIFTTSDKQSQEKIDILRALGAEVVVCPTNVAPDDPRSYYSVAERLSKEIPNSYWVNQYDNLSNREAHYDSTGPEIWEQTDGKITHFVVPTGTGGTISGTGRYLKEKNPDIKIWAVDSYGSVFKKYHETGIFDEKEIYPYILEGVGEDILPKNVDFELIDLFEKVTDKDAAVMTRRMAREEGLLVGYSAGSALQGIVQLKDQLKEGDVVVAILHDHGSRYINKVYNDQWMTEQGFMPAGNLLRDFLETRQDHTLITAHPDETLKEVLGKMTEKGISQVPVMEYGEPAGALYEKDILKFILKDPKNLQVEVRGIMKEAMEVISYDAGIQEAAQLLTRSGKPLLTKDRSGQYQMITSHDLLKNFNA